MWLPPVANAVRLFSPPANGDWLEFSAFVASDAAADVDDVGGGPGSAGKSSLDMVNSLVSMAGCFTIPTAKKRNAVRSEADS
jgi:hypothetical protein